MFVKCAIIGAGLAGLTTAHRLDEAGIDVHVYEARGRVGGRVFSVRANGQVAELGAQNIADGGDAKNLLRLVDEFGLEVIKSSVSAERYYFDGKEFLSIKDAAVSWERLQAIAEKAGNMRDVLDVLFDREDPHYKVLCTRLAAYEGGTVDNLSTKYIETLYHMLRGGIAAAHQSYEIEFVRLKEGNALLAEAMGDALGDRLHLNHVLKGVSKKKRYILHFDDGDVEADIVVLAIPCSVYKDITFGEGVIPEERLEAIRSIPYGQNAKVIIPWNETVPARRFFMNDRSVAFFDGECRVLTLYYVGEASQFSEKTLQATYAGEKGMIEQALGRDVPSPIFVRDEAFSSYPGAIAYSWPNDPYAKGTYGYVPPGGEKNKGVFDPIGNLYFAGEHVSTLEDVPGTMEAACESGENSAKLIISMLR